MSYFEFIITGELTPVLEERTNKIVTDIGFGNSPFMLHKYYDDEIPNTEGKKKRTIIITSPVNVRLILFTYYFNECAVQLTGYYKQLIT